MHLDPCGSGMFIQIREPRTIVINSPGYSEDPSAAYPKGASCTWDISVAQHLQMSVVFVDMDIESAADCDFDYFQFSGENGWVSQKYCGQEIAPNKKIEGTSLKIVFQSDDNVEKRGFKLGINTLLNNGDQMDCNFDFGFCNGWVNNPMGDQNLFDWQLGLGQTKTDGTGPSSDHSSVEGMGQYAFIDASNKVENAMAVLVSPEITIEELTSYCLEYWWHNFGDEIGQVAVLADFLDRRGPDQDPEKR